MAALSERGVEVLVFKGADFHLRYFDSQPLGAMADVDVLVRRADVEATREALFGLGFRHGLYDAYLGRPRYFPREEADDPDHYEIGGLLRPEPFELSRAEAEAVEANAVPVPMWLADDGATCLAVGFDVHHGVASNLPGEGFIERGRPGVGGAGLSMCAGDLLWVTLARYYTEVAVDRKRSLRDLAYAIALLREPIDWDEVVRAVTEHRLGSALYYYLSTLRRTFGADVPDEVLRATHPLHTPRLRDWGWQLGVLFDFMEPEPVLLPGG